MDVCHSLSRQDILQDCWTLAEIRTVSMRAYAGLVLSTSLGSILSRPRLTIAPDPLLTETRFWHKKTLQLQESTVLYVALGKEKPPMGRYFGPTATYFKSNKQGFLMHGAKEVDGLLGRDAQVAWGTRLLYQFPSSAICRELQQT